MIELVGIVNFSHIINLSLLFFLFLDYKTYLKGVLSP